MTQEDLEIYFDDEPVMMTGEEIEIWFTQNLIPEGAIIFYYVDEDLGGLIFSHAAMSIGGDTMSFENVNNAPQVVDFNGEDLGPHAIIDTQTYRYV